MIKVGPVASEKDPPPFEIPDGPFPFLELLGIRIIRITHDRAEGDLVVRPDLLNRNGVLHGGAIMALADGLAGVASFATLRPQGLRTTTIESKTNFFSSIRIGQTASAVSVLLHRGRTTTVWQTTITGPAEKLAAIVTQTQLVLS